MKYHVPLDLPLTPDLCEFIGAFIGDGCLYKYPRTGAVQFTGHPVEDRKYYEKTIIPIGTACFGMVPKISVRSDRLQVRFYSQELFHLFVQRFGFTPGPKAFTVHIPEEILAAPPECVFACTRGLFDTDGGVGIDKRPTYKEHYVRLNFVTSSRILMKQVAAVLQRASFSFSIHSRNNERQLQLQINGKKQVHQFVGLIGLSNNRHRDKIVGAQ